MPWVTVGGSLQTPYPARTRNPAGLALTSTPCGDSSYVTAPGESNYHFSGEAPKACAAEGGAAHAVCCGD